MKIRQFEIWIANLDPRRGTESGKTRSVLVVQTDLLNKFGHPSTLVCPITSNVQSEAEILRVHLNKGISGLHKNCDVMIDQLRAIDNRRLERQIGILPDDLQIQVKNNLLSVLNLL
jgi:mRNA interferase MazF